MFKHEKKLFHPVEIEKPNPQYAVLLQEQLGGGNGELKAAMQYMSQSFRVKDKEIKDLFLDIAAEELIGNNSHRDCGYCAEDKHESAHGRRALLFLVPLRTDFKNSLPEMELSQPRNYGKPEQRGDERRGRRAHYQCCDSVHCFFLPVSCGSPRIFLTVSRSSSGNFSPPIS